ncbi:MAG: OB-fold nucleic acid binding domain-containing protein, partial [Nitrospinota bacterium]|nr:OB-fold nucleic acid binding domain-containing protein [Nitrospinota bacterium]
MREIEAALITETVQEMCVRANRDLGGVIFIDIRDREGRTQAVFDPSDLPVDLFETASKLHSESVISVTG